MPALREEDLKPTAEREANETEPKLSLSWSPQSLHDIEPPN